MNKNIPATPPMTTVTAKATTKMATRNTNNIFKVAISVKQI